MRSVVTCSTDSRRKARAWPLIRRCSRSSTSAARCSRARSTGSTRRRSARSGASRTSTSRRTRVDWQRITPEQQTGPARRHDPVPRGRAGRHRRARADARGRARAPPLRLDDVPLDVPDGGGEARRVLHALARGRSSAILDPDEVAPHFLVRGKTIDPTGRFEVRDVLHEALPYYGGRLLEASTRGTEAEIERAFVQFSAAYNAFVEGVLTMPSYEIVIDTTAQWDAFPTLNQGFKLILMDEGRHITFGTEACRILIEKDPSYEERGARGLRRVSRQRRRPRRVPEGRAGARPREVPDDEGAPLPQPLPRDGRSPPTRR